MEQMLKRSNILPSAVALALLTVLLFEGFAVLSVVATSLGRLRSGISEDFVCVVLQEGNVSGGRSCLPLFSLW